MATFAVGDQLNLRAFTDLAIAAADVIADARHGRVPDRRTDAVTLSQLKRPPVPASFTTTGLVLRGVRSALGGGSRVFACVRG